MDPDACTGWRKLQMIKAFVASFERQFWRFPFVGSLYSKPYRRIVANEISLAGIGFRDTVLNVGCGSIPFTAIYTALQTGAQVYAVDCDRRAVEFAKAYIRRHHKNLRINVVHGNGTDRLGINFDVAVVALQAGPKGKILEMLSQSSSQKARFVFREPSSEYSSQYDPMPSSLEPDGSIYQGMPTFRRSLLFLNSSISQRSSAV